MLGRIGLGIILLLLFENFWKIKAVIKTEYEEVKNSENSNRK